MMQFIFSMAMSISLVSVLGLSPAIAVESPQVQVTGVIEHVEAMENEAMVKLVDVQQLYIIKNMMIFPEIKLQVLMDSQEKGSPVKLKVRQNQILDVVL